MKKPRCLIISVGTTGDTLPLVGLGEALRRAGHDVVMATNEAFKTHIERAGLGFEDLGAAELYREAVAHPDFHHPIKSVSLTGDKILFPVLEKSIDVTREYTKDGGTLVLASQVTFGARIAYDLAPFPLVTVHFSPFSFSSTYDLRRAPGPNLRPWSPRPLKSAYLRLCDALADSYFCPPINALRAKRGLPPVKRIISHWSESPDLVLGLFPDWFAKPQPDWPSQTRLTEFPLYDPGDSLTIPEELFPFLDEPSPLLIFTLGSAAVESVARRFFEESVAASQILGCRALLLTGSRAHVPAALPPNVRHCAFVPHSQILPRTSVMIHHVGIGTAASALAAGVPQLGVPLGFDQFDNASRLERLGVARTLGVEAYKGETAAKLLKELMESVEVRARCRDYQDRLARRKPFEETLRVLEEFAVGK